MKLEDMAQVKVLWHTDGQMEEWVLASLYFQAWKHSG